ncbi:PRC and DUF2382 domain-containing protein [Propionimicrobium sp. PCR01-08-3]|uniref:PRC and DUF2382 domain-containing protein n=1 Tax=Propionimicrobium sp. PCR01-08-3 TaxID=3052086 RepID=UPI00255C2C9D|nr:PRC and DUF2382 domain-containing protein [Propionimicrobium sp. PCR01-08-3]WIY82925.1 PRC and DUF2382 domain-containing protein [Propionimicrobium sp. PCR01-08-3]
MVDDQNDFRALENATVYDNENKRIGTVGQIYVDNQTGRPKFVTVNLGLFGTRETFLPVDAARQNNGDLTVPFSKDFIKGAPSIEADGELTPKEESELFRYYADGMTSGEHGTPAAGRGTNTVRGRAEGDRARVGDEETLVAHEERLRVNTQQQEAGRARLRKRVRTEKENIEVPVQREELVVDREAIDPNSAEARAAGPIGETANEDEVVTLKEERPVVDKETVATEKVNVGKRTVQDSETVSADLRKEEIDVDQDDARRR